MCLREGECRFGRPLGVPASGRSTPLHNPGASNIKGESGHSWIVGHSDFILSRFRAENWIDVGKSSSYQLSQTEIASEYLRGQAYLATHRGNEAAAEFQKILDHRGVVQNLPIGALAHLQIGRACAMQGDIVKARTAYQDFLTLWKDADADIPILIAAKAEYAKLK